MELTNEFRVGIPVEQAWGVLTDVERIAPCLPGAQLQEVDGDEYRGIVKVKVGPITAQYKGKASFIEQDAAAGRAVLRAEGRDTRGQGNANATITALLTADGGGTAVKVVTDLTITGKVAQFGRGVLAEVSAKLLDQFVESLERDVLGGPSAGEPAADAGPAPSVASPQSDPIPVTGEAGRAAPAGNGPAGAPASSNGSSSASGVADAAGPRRIEHAPAEPVDLLSTAGAPVAKRVLPAAGGLIVAGLLIAWWRRRHARR